MFKFQKLLIIAIVINSQLWAIMEYSPELQQMYRESSAKMITTSVSLDTKMEHAMVLTYMGKVEEAGALLKEIDREDDNYKHSLRARLVAEELASPNLASDWQHNIKLGFVTYFLAEEAHGKIELYTRRIARGKRDKNQQKIDKGRSDRKKMWPIYNCYWKSSYDYFQRVANKEPKDSMNAWGYSYQAVLYAMDKDWQKAKDYCEKALAIEPDAYGIRAAYMEAVRQTGSYLIAMSEMRKAFALRDKQQKYEKKLFGSEVK